jgi:hypothetical protein
MPGRRAINLIRSTYADQHCCDLNKELQKNKGRIVKTSLITSAQQLFDTRTWKNVVHVLLYTQGN